MNRIKKTKHMPTTVKNNKHTFGLVSPATVMFPPGCPCLCLASKHIRLPAGFACLLLLPVLDCFSRCWNTCFWFWLPVMPFGVVSAFSSPKWLQPECGNPFKQQRPKHKKPPHTHTHQKKHIFHFDASAPVSGGFGCGNRPPNPSAEARISVLKTRCTSALSRPRTQSSAWPRLVWAYERSGPTRLLRFSIPSAGIPIPFLGAEAWVFVQESRS